jgi:DNA-binding NtrC family response regulator
LPPLRERGKDIITLAEFFLRKYIQKYNKKDLRINQQAFDKLMDYSWPGNIRELQNTIEKAVILSDTSVIKPEDLYLKPASRSMSFDSVPTLEEMEQQMISMAIDNNNGNLTAAAEQLGITRQTLYNRLKKSQRK